MSKHDPEVVDDSEVLRDAFEEPEEPMNVKSGGAILGALIVAVASSVLNHLWDGSNSKESTLNATASAVAALNTKVEGLADQVKQLTEQPYVRRDEFEGRVSGLEQRVNLIERPQQQRR